MQEHARDCTIILCIIIIILLYQSFACYSFHKVFTHVLHTLLHSQYSLFAYKV